MKKSIDANLIQPDIDQENIDTYNRAIKGLEIILQRLRNSEISANEARLEIAHVDPDWQLMVQKHDEPLSYEQVENLIQEEVYRLEDEQRATLPGKY